MAETGRLVGLVVTLVAAVVVIAAVAVPVLSSVTDGVYVTAENEDYDMRMSVITDGYYKIEWVQTGCIAITTEKGGEATTYYGTNYSDEGTTLVDGMLGGYTGFSSGYVAVTTETLMIAVRTTDMLMILMGAEGSGTSGLNMITSGAYLEYDDGTVTVYRASTGDYYYETSEYITVPDPDGDWVMTSAGWVDYGGTYYLVGRYVFGSLVEGGDADIQIDSATDITVTENIIEEGSRAAYIGTPNVTYTLNGVTTGSGTLVVVVPLEYSTTTSSQDTLLSLVDVIPLLLVLMTLLVAAYAVIRSAQE